MILPEGQDVSVPVTIYATDNGDVRVLSGTLLRRDGERITLSSEHALVAGASVIIEPEDGVRMRGEVATADGNGAVVRIHVERAADVRTSARVAIEGEVRYRPVLDADPNGAWATARPNVVANMGGLLLFTREPHPLDEELLVELCLRGGERRRASGRVTRCKPDGSEFAVALLFTEVSPEFEDALLDGIEEE